MEDYPVLIQKVLHNPGAILGTVLIIYGLVSFRGGSYIRERMVYMTSPIAKGSLFTRPIRKIEGEQAIKIGEENVKGSFFWIILGVFFIALPNYALPKPYLDQVDVAHLCKKSNIPENDPRCEDDAQVVAVDFRNEINEQLIIPQAPQETFNEYLGFVEKCQELDTVVLCRYTFKDDTLDFAVYFSSDGTYLQMWSP